jgi:cell division protein FtsL
MLRLINIALVLAVIGSAAYVYSIKYESTKYAERIANMRNDIRKEREAIATLRAEWASLNKPERLQGLAERHLTLKPVTVDQIDTLERLPERPTRIVPNTADDPIAAMIEAAKQAPAPLTTGSVPRPAPRSVAPVTPRPAASPAASPATSAAPPRPSAAVPSAPPRPSLMPLSLTPPAPIPSAR